MKKNLLAIGMLMVLSISLKGAAFEEDAQGVARAFEQAPRYSRTDWQQTLTRLGYRGTDHPLALDMVARRLEERGVNPFFQTREHMNIIRNEIGSTNDIRTFTTNYR